MLRWLAAILVAMSLGVPATWAADSQGQYTVYGAGGLSCGDWAKGRNNAENFEVIKQWFMGFVTAYNLYTPGMNDVGANVDLKQLYNIIDEYCLDHTSAKLSDAGEQLIIRLKREAPADE